ncbi:MAG TPA: hypothetical protein VFR86_25880 [Burkholderiaceae bacterium]|nr:hypothetical protein [Burkholderiaceae bacterium]
MKDDRSSKPRRKSTDEGFRKPPRAGERPARFTRKPPGGEGGAGEQPARFARKPRGEEGDFSDPYRPAQRPAGPRTGAREFTPRGGGRGFTVTLDPDIARVFRGDASVNRALRLVLQLMQVVQGPPQRAGGGARGEGFERPRRGYQGSAEARGFTRKPRFEEDDES